MIKLISRLIILIVITVIALAIWIVNNEIKGSGYTIMT